jgi:hypothetical protein
MSQEQKQAGGDVRATSGKQVRLTTLASCAG